MGDNSKTMNVRMSQKHDIEANWKKAVNFIPKDGEVIIYDAEIVGQKDQLLDADGVQFRSYYITEPRIKIGDGISKINDLPFIQGVGFIGTGEKAEIFNHKSNVASGAYSHAEGNKTTSSGEATHAEGIETEAIGRAAHGEGHKTHAGGNYSHTEGYLSIAGGAVSHAEGQGAQAKGSYSHAEGYQTEATASIAHAEGKMTAADGYSSHAEGESTSAIGEVSHAEGKSTRARGNYSHAEGFQTEATYTAAHAEGYNAKATGLYAHAEGFGTEAANTATHAEGNATKAMCQYSHTEGWETETWGEATAAHAEGFRTSAQGLYSHAEGNESETLGQAAHAEGWRSKANGGYSHAEGNKTQANGESSHAEGYNTQANGICAHAEGQNTIADGDAAHAEGYNTKAYALGTHAEGIGCQAWGEMGAHAEGYHTWVIDGHAEGIGTQLETYGGHVQGRYNLNRNGLWAHVVGNGTSDSKRSDAHTLDWDGNAWYAGRITMGAEPTRDMDAVPKKYIDKLIPPMLYNVAYLTGEKYNGKNIYRKLDSFGNRLWRFEDEGAWHSESKISCIEANKLQDYIHNRTFDTDETIMLSGICDTRIMLGRDKNNMTYEGTEWVENIHKDVSKYSSVRKIKSLTFDGAGKATMHGFDLLNGKVFFGDDNNATVENGRAYYVTTTYEIGTIAFKNMTITDHVDFEDTYGHVNLEHIIFDNVTFIDKGSMTDNASFIFISGNYNGIKNITIRNCTFTGSDIWRPVYALCGADTDINITIENCVFDGSCWNAIQINGQNGASFGGKISINNNYIFDIPDYVIQFTNISGRFICCGNTLINTGSYLGHPGLSSVAGNDSAISTVANNVYSKDGTNAAILNGRHG